MLPNKSEPEGLTSISPGGASYYILMKVYRDRFLQNNMYYKTSCAYYVIRVSFGFMLTSKFIWNEIICCEKI